jgi:bifunctional DNase/RNase
VTTLYYIDGYSHREVSSFLGVPLGTVKRRLHEAREILKGRLAMVQEDLKRRRPGPAFSRRVLERIDSVQVEVKDETAGGLLLTDKKGRSFLVFVARPEALSIRMALQGTKPRRPLTHDLFVNTIRQLGGTIVELVISALKENIFYGVLVIRLGRDRHEIDCRPSDGVALALRAGAPIYIHKGVADRVVMKRKDGRPLSRAGALRALRKTPILFSVSEEDRKKIAEAPGALEAFEKAARVLAQWHSTGKSELLARGMEWFGKYLERKAATRGFPILPPLPLAAYQKLQHEKAFQEVMKKQHLSLTVDATGMKVTTSSKQGHSVLLTDPREAAAQVTRRPV